MSSDLYIGLISGTSMDAIDCALAEVAEGHFKLIDFISKPFPDALRAQTLNLARATAFTWEQLGDVDIGLARIFAEAAQEMLAKHSLSHQEIAAIGCHGQTLWHQPTPTAQGNRFTWQMGDPNSITYLTGITTVSDFRRYDLAAGGQGAPLVPAFHVSQFSSRKTSRIVVNLGGIANITVIRPQLISFGYDTGPANILMDAWIQKHRHLTFDRDGAWAASGCPNMKLLSCMLDEPYLGIPPPKSTGRELFNLEWLAERAGDQLNSLRPEDVQATLLAFTATTVANEINRHANLGEVLICGGGAHNEMLMSSLRLMLPNFQVETTAQYGLDPDAVEAAAFAWFAQQTLAGKKIDFTPFTGALQPATAGGIYRP